MPPQSSATPVVLAIAGHDPSGAAGIHADIETISACGVRSASLITATTAQDTTSFVRIRPQSAADFAEQADLLLADMDFAACKIGLLGTAEIAGVVAEFIPRLGNAPVVLDPVLRSGTGTALADGALQDAIRTRLVPLCAVITPNAAEARALAGCDDGPEAARRLLLLGARNVLITGADADTPGVTNTLYRQDGSQTRYDYPRLPAVFHGSGCTLSASLAAFLARGYELQPAVRAALDFTWAALHAADRLGRGQLHPNRFPASGSGTGVR
ncbi:MAG: hydroxymethylpyrimidine/phosphomethylpyrimidine kinase [Gammaproteobacteria bacterium]|nr:hydroxymethylpyrimidine/phosphomethylpyrimidine kinase [Gammaproteobacteria bacterium]